MVLALGLVTALGLLAACSAQRSQSSNDAIADIPHAVSQTTTPGGLPSATLPAPFPITATNCGFDVELAAPPQRILAIKSTSLELLLALGLQDRVVGAAFLDGPIPEQWAQAAADIPIISDGPPATEPVLELAPDLILAGWESNLTAETAGDRTFLAEHGMATLVSPAACQGANQPPLLTFPLLFDQFAEMGRYLGAPEAAADLIAQQSAQLGTVPQAQSRMRTLWWSSARTTPYVGAGIGAPQLVMDAVGLENIAADIRETWTPLGWEAIIAADPEVIVVVDSPGNRATEKIDYLHNTPATQAISAVKNERFITVEFAAAEAGVRSVAAAMSIGSQLAAMGLGT